MFEYCFEGNKYTRNNTREHYALSEKVHSLCFQKAAQGTIQCP